jgi:hypothetical protein
MTQALREFLTKKLATEAPLAEHYNELYRGESGIGFIDPMVRRLYGDRVKALNINHAATAVNPLSQLLNVAGFRSSAGDIVDNDVTGLWRDTGMDAYSQMAHVEAMVSGRAHFMVWAMDGQPVVTPESPQQVVVMRDPVTRQEIAAMKRYRGDDGHTYSIVMTPDTIDTYASRVAAAPDPGYTHPTQVMGEDMALVSSEPNPLGIVPVVTLANQPRITAPDGRSDLADIETLLVAVAKLGSDLMTASEANATPHRIVAVPASAGDLTNEQADRIRDRVSHSTSRPAAAHVGVLSGGADIKELSTASLDNFDRAIRLLVSQIAAVAGLPPYFVSGDVANPTSADAIRAATSRLTARAVERQRWYGPSYARLMRMVVMVRDGVPDPRLADLSTLWTDPTPASTAQEADAAVKLYAAGITDRRAALEALDLPPLEVERVLAAAPATDPAELPATTTPVVHMTMPEPKPRRRRVETDEKGRIVAVVDEPA